MQVKFKLFGFSHLFLCIVFLFKSQAVGLRLAHASENKEMLESKLAHGRFTPHITAEARTRAKGKFSFQRAVGANLNTNFYLSSLIYSVFDRLEVGSVIFNYFTENHIFNINFKYNFWRTEQFNWTVGLTQSISQLENQDEDPNLNNVDISINAVQILFNYFPKNSKFKYGFNLNSVSTSLLGFNGSDKDFEIGNIAEYGLDISYSINDLYDVTFGLGWLRDTGFSALEEIQFGSGVSFRWYRPKLFFSSPTFGFHYAPESRASQILFSTSFY